MSTSQPTRKRSIETVLEERIRRLEFQTESLRLLKESWAVTTTVMLLVPFAALRPLLSTAVSSWWGPIVGALLLVGSLRALGTRLLAARRQVLDDQHDRIMKHVQDVLDTLHRHAGALEFDPCGSTPQRGESLRGISPAPSPEAFTGA
jgi:hypothetical protein